MSMMSMFVPTELTPLRDKIGEGVSYTVQKTVGFWEEFADFLGRSSVAELAIGIVIGTAFQVLVPPLLLPPPSSTTTNLARCSLVRDFCDFHKSHALCPPVVVAT
jgi:hypothetical protein